jgi:CheY-like chemotaxis protein
MDGLAELKILVVEDEPLIAMALEEMLTDLGCTVVGPALSLERGMRLATDESIDGAILDVNLGGETVFPLADLLAQRDVPFVYVTGYGALLRACDNGRPVLQKPYNAPALIKIASRWRRTA